MFIKFISAAYGKVPAVNLWRYNASYCIVLLALMLSACASTDELYADYDAASCPVIAAATADKVVLRDLVTSEKMLWEPAVYFEFDKDELANTEQTRLDMDIAVMKRYPVLRLAIRGFTDQKGTNKYNKVLSEKRVEVVSQYLQSKGLNKNRIEIVALGEEVPILNTSDELADAIHRRVELLLLDGTGRPLAYDLDVADAQKSKHPPAVKKAAQLPVAAAAKKALLPTSTSSPQINSSSEQPSSSAAELVAEPTTKPSVVPASSSAPGVEHSPIQITPKNNVLPDEAPLPKVPSLPARPLREIH